MRTVKISVLLEFELATDSTEEEVLASTQEQIAQAVRPEWKGFHFPRALHGEFVGKAKTAVVALGHNIFAPPVPRPRPRKRRR